MIRKKILRPPPTPAPVPLTELVKAANGGDAAARQELKEVLDTNPEIWRSVGDLAQHAEDVLLTKISRGDPFLADCVRRQAAALRDEMGGTKGPVLERMAVKRVVIAWLELALIDAEHPAGAANGLPELRFVVLAKGAAQRRYDSAVRSLMLVREKLRNRTQLRVVPFAANTGTAGPAAAASA